MLSCCLTVVIDDDQLNLDLTINTISCFKASIDLPTHTSHAFQNATLKKKWDGARYKATTTQKYHRGGQLEKCPAWTLHDLPPPGERICEIANEKGKILKKKVLTKISN